MNFVLLNSFYQIIKNQSVNVNFISTTWAPLKLIAAQNMKFSIKNFSSKCDQVRSFLKKSLMENFIFCAVTLLKHWSFHSDIQTHLNSLREKYPDSKFSWSVFNSNIVWENTDQKKTPYLDNFHAVTASQILKVR